MTGRAPLRGILAVGSAIAAVLVLGSVSFASFVGSIERTERAPARSADAIVALTGGAQRIEDAVDLLARGYGRRLLITGVNERTTRTQIARLNPAQRRLLECCVDLDYRAQNTIGNAAETSRWTRRNGFRSLIVVTSNYHMPRTLAEFDHALPEVSKIAHPVVSSALDGATWPSRLAGWRLLGAEYVKYLASRVRAAVLPPNVVGLGGADLTMAARVPVRR